jgi:hypothetical protein
MSAQIESSTNNKSAPKHLLKGGAKLFGVILLFILAMMIVLGLLPVSIKELVSSPDPAGDYEGALRRFKRILEREDG